MTRQRLDDQNLQTFEQAMGQTPGLTYLPFRNGSGTFMMRGFEVSQFQFDGLL